MMRDWLTKDFGWKLFSIFLALVIWVTVHEVYEEPHGAAIWVTGNPVTYGNLPVFIVSTAANVHDFRVAPSVVSVTVSGAPKIMSVLQANQIRAVVDLTDLKPDSDLHRHVDISTPPGVTLVKVEPSEVGVIIPPVPAKKP
jgi:YbbR domain-containing protein